jgi:hypothetical protein
MSLETSTAILAVATVVLAVATVVLVVVGWSQIVSIRNDARKTRTLEICNRYETCPILHAAVSKLRTARDAHAYEQNRRAYRIDAITLLNYLDSIAIGIEQNLYIDDLAYDHVGPVLKHHVEEYLNVKEAAGLGINLGNFETLQACYDRWYPKVPVVGKPKRFQDRFFRRK